MLVDDTIGLRQALAVRHRGCLPGLARLRLMATEAPPVPRVRSLEAALSEVLGELHEAGRIVIEAHGDQARRASARRFLACRHRRLDIVGGDAAAAAAVGDVAALRRLLFQFHALAVALRQVQFGLLDRVAPSLERDRDKEGVMAPWSG